MCPAPRTYPAYSTSSLLCRVAVPHRKLYCRVSVRVNVIHHPRRFYWFWRAGQLIPGITLTIHKSYAMAINTEKEFIVVVPSLTHSIISYATISLLPLHCTILNDP